MRKTIVAVLIGLAALPLQLACYLIIGLFLEAAGTTVDSLHILFAPGGGSSGGLGAYFFGVVFFRLTVFMVSLVVLLGISWKLFHSISMCVLTLGGAALITVGAIAINHQTVSSISREARESAKLGDKSIAETISLTAIHAELIEPLSQAVDPSYVPEYETAYATLKLRFDVTVRRTGNYLVHLTLLPKELPTSVGDIRKLGERFAFEFDQALSVGEQSFFNEITVSELSAQRGLLWSLVDAGVSELQVTLYYLADVNDLEELYNTSFEESLNVLRQMGGREEYLRELKPKNPSRIEKFVLRETHEIDVVVLKRTLAR